LPLKSVDQARRFSQLLVDRADQASTLSIVVVGSGYTGTELAGELAEPGNLPLGAGRRAVNVTVVSMDSRLLAEGNERLAAVAQRALTAKGVRFLLGVRVQQVDAAGVMLESGRRIPADLVVWAARTRAPREVAQDGVMAGLAGKIAVDPYLRVPGCEGVYAAGDVALVRDYRWGTYVPATAQFALGQADTMAHNIAAELDGQGLQEYRPHSLGEALSLGGKEGVAELGGVLVTGNAALAAKNAALARYLYRLGGLRLVRQYA
jgi:NADH dehydrogenase